MLPCSQEGGDPRIKASEKTVAEALTGDYRPEHLFTLKQSREAYRYYEKLRAACDGEIETYLKGFGSKLDAQSPPLAKPKDSPAGTSCDLICAHSSTGFSA